MDKRILDYWNRLLSWPLGKSLFSWFLGLRVPYSGSLRPDVLQLERGFARVRMRDRWAVRNHLGSIHAAALMNLAEAASGLAFLSVLPTDARGIVKRFSIEYVKKGRGTLIAESQCEAPQSNEQKEYSVQAVIRDYSQDIVAVGTSTWLVGPKK
ncbi:MAG: DUF4442 domain-containing protein [Deltaproteobacteria bacterium]|nr:DUF4442 domain-containing protein [Deltaproteobacteria bacterium]